MPRSDSDANAPAPPRTGRNDWRAWLALAWVAWFGIAYGRMVVERRGPKLRAAIAARPAEPRTVR